MANSINLLSVKEYDTFSDRLKGRYYKITVGYFYLPADNPFSFDDGFYIAFQSSFLMGTTTFTMLGVSKEGIIEGKLVNL